MTFTELPLPGAWLVELDPHGDARGSFVRTFCADEFAAHGLSATFVQANETSNADVGTVRGLHWQRAPRGETKLVRCTRGRVFDVIVDVRDASPTRHRWHGVDLRAGDDRQIFIPEGFAHGYQVLEPDTVLTYLMGARYAPEAATGLRWDDPALGIDWPLDADPRLSPRDAAWPLLER